MNDLPCGCPGSSVRTLDKPGPPCNGAAPTGSTPSELRQWPVQLTLVPPSAPWFAGADLLVAADCGPFAYPDYHRDFLRGKVVVNDCPKLDQADAHVQKLTAIFANNDIRSVTVTIMEVPCCMGLNMIVTEAMQAAGVDVPLTRAVIGVNGDRKEVPCAT